MITDENLLIFSSVSLSSAKHVAVFFSSLAVILARGHHLLKAQNRLGAHLRHAPGWKIAGQERHRREQRPGDDPRYPIRRACIVEQARQYARKRERRAGAESESNQDDEHCFSDHKL